MFIEGNFYLKHYIRVFFLHLKSMDSFLISTGFEPKSFSQHFAKLFSQVNAF
jgi:hypothetical protein